MSTAFWKMHGNGNDFVLMRRADLVQLPQPAMVQALSDRHRGIGFDQLLTVDVDEAAFVIFNADGSVAEQCGNGLRCVAAWLAAQRPQLGSCFVLNSPSGEHQVVLHPDGQVSASMGSPRLGEPLVLDDGDASRPLQPVSMGNPHAVVRVEDVDGLDLQRLAGRVAAMAAFADGVNLGALQVISPQHARLRVFERGAGETLACGSGACAAMAAARHNGWLDQQAELLMPGGRLVLEWKSTDEPLWMTGSAVSVYHGFIDLSM